MPNKPATTKPALDELKDLRRKLKEHERLEARFRQTEGTLRAILESTADGILVIDEQGKVIYANERFGEMWHIPESVIETRDDRELIPFVLDQLVDPQDFEARVKVLYQTREAAFDTIHFKDGRLFERYSRPLMVKNKITGRVWSFRDVTFYKTAEELALRENAKLSAMISGMEEGVIFANKDDFIIEINEYFCRMLKIERNNVLGTNLRDFQLASLIEDLDDYIQRFKDTHYCEPLHLQQPIGETEVFLRLQPIYHDNKYDGVLLNLIDVTRLVKARQQAEAANLAKNKFLATVSHEIRTPLNGVIGMTDLALSNCFDDEQREYLDAIKISADSLLSVINDILDFSKIEAGKLDFYQVDFGIREFLKEFFQTIEPRAKQKGLELKYCLEDEVPDKLVGDPERLRQVLLNLLGNALKFTEQGNIEVKAELKTLKTDKVVLQFSVHDTGIGIPADQHERIFEAFTQVDGSDTRKF
ncbi:MAG: PAS domain S-box protein, partial [Deltaproteobacteria bacterium]|nr:PAS domain S-box protein [Deltaproteobacteria bacterium]